jgi:hypothetical protein
MTTAHTLDMQALLLAYPRLPPLLVSLLLRELRLLQRRCVLNEF